VQILEPAIDAYLQRLAASDDPVLVEMERLAADESFPIVGPQVGRLFVVLARLGGARRVLELGSGFGYSAYWWALALGPAGRVVACEASPERAERGREFLARGGLLERVEIVVGDALQIAARHGKEIAGGGGTEGRFDVVFNDVDKKDYPRVLPLAEATLRPGGLFVSDNMLWSGRVVEPGTPSPSTRGVQELTERLHASPRFETTLVPLRDGVTVSVFRG
jgi:predicted O-methyltransferase YrrM